MAFLDVTQWNDIQETAATNEKRFAELGIVDAVKASTPATSEYIPPSAQEALKKASASRAVQIPVIKDQNVTVVTTPGFDFIPDNLPETDQYSFTSFDVFSGFRHYPAAYDNNVLDAEFARNQVMRNVSYAMGNSIETILAAELETRKTQLLDNTLQVSQGDGTYTFNAGTDTLEVNKAAQKETMFYNLEQLMDSNELEGMYRIATNRAGLSVQISEAAKFGANNDKNLNALGFLPMDRIHQSGNISGGADIFNGWFLRDGSIGMIENFPYDFRNQTEINGQKWNITDMELPFAKMRANVYTNSEATDATALITPSTDTNMIMTTFEEMAVWIRFYVVYRYNSDLSTRAQDIVKIKGLTT
jgi:hypothetical protein